MTKTESTGKKKMPATKKKETLSATEPLVKTMKEKLTKKKATFRELVEKSL